MKLFTENVTEYFAHVQRLYQASPQGGGPGNEANEPPQQSWSSIPSCVESHFKMCPYMDYNLLLLTSFRVTIIGTYKQTHKAWGALITTVSLWQPTCKVLYYGFSRAALALTIANSHLNKVGAEHTAYLIRCVLEALNLTEDGTNAPLPPAHKLLVACVNVFCLTSICVTLSISLSDSFNTVLYLTLKTSVVLFCCCLAI